MFNKIASDYFSFVTNVDRYLGRFSFWLWLKDASYPIAIFLITRAALVFAVYFGIVLFAGSMKAHFAPGVFPNNILLTPWARWDTVHYSLIVRQGYQAFGSAAFFPLFPFLASIVNVLVRQATVSTIIVANCSFLIGLIFFYKLVRDKFKDQQLAERAVLYLSIFPTTFFFMSGLTEGTFFLMSVLTFYFAEKDNWRLAGLFGVLTALVRSNGFLIALPMILLYLWQKKFDLRKIRPDIILAAIAPLGLFIFMGLLMLYGKGPLDFIVAGQKAWPRIFAWPLWDLWRSIEQLFSFHPAAFIAGNFPVRLLAGVLLVSAFLLLSIVSIFKIDKSYGIYSLILILFALANPAKEWQLYGDLRFILVVFPVFILLAQFGRRKLANVAIVVFSLFFLALFALYNGMGGWIS